MGRAHKFDKLIAEKCVEDASKYIYYIFRRGVFWLVIAKCQIELCSARSLIVFWNVCDLVEISEDFDG